MNSEVIKGHMWSSKDLKWFFMRFNFSLTSECQPFCKILSLVLWSPCKPSWQLINKLEVWIFDIPAGKSLNKNAKKGKQELAYNINAIKK